MVEEKVTIVNDIGLHARPASRLLSETMKFQSNVKFIKDNVEYEGKSIISVLSMKAYKGSEVIVRCEGEDEMVALDSIIHCISEELPHL